MVSVGPSWCHHFCFFARKDTIFEAWRQQGPVAHDCSLPFFWKVWQYHLWQVFCKTSLQRNLSLKNLRQQPGSKHFPLFQWSIFWLVKCSNCVAWWLLPFVMQELLELLKAQSLSCYSNGAQGSQETKQIMEKYNHALQGGVMCGRTVVSILHGFTTALRRLTLAAHHMIHN